MKKPFLLLILLNIISGCQFKSDTQIDLTPVYTNFDNTWEERNLFGEIKTLEERKVIYQKVKETEKTITTLREEYTHFGQLKAVTYFDDRGEQTQHNQYFYNDQEYRNKIISINNIEPQQKIIQLISFDSINNSSTSFITINDSIEIKHISIFNEKDHIRKQVRIENQDTIITPYTYEYNSKGKLISEKKTEEDSKEIYINDYKYDEQGNLIELSNKSKWFHYKTKTDWEDYRITKQTYYTITNDTKEHIDKIIEYNRSYLPINIKYYNGPELNRELKFIYEFDKKGNWIKRLVSLKEHTANSDSFIPIYTETRDITYWNK